MNLSLGLLLATLVQAGAGADCHCDLLKLTERNSGSSR